MPVPDDLAKLSNVVNNYVVKKTVYDKLVAKVNNIDTTAFVLKTKYDTDKSDLKEEISDVEKKIPNTSALVRNTDLSAKVSEIESEIPSISGLVTSAALTAVQNKIHDVSKYITTANYKKFTKDIVDNSIKNKNLVTKTDFDAKLQNISKRITSNKSKHLLDEN